MIYTIKFKYVFLFILFTIVCAILIIFYIGEKSDERASLKERERNGKLKIRCRKQPKGYKKRISMPVETKSYKNGKADYVLIDLRSKPEMDGCPDPRLHWKLGVSKGGEYINKVVWGFPKQDHSPPPDNGGNPDQPYPGYHNDSHPGFGGINQTNGDYYDMNQTGLPDRSHNSSEGVLPPGWYPPPL